MSLGKPDGGLPPADVIQSETEIQSDIDRLVKQYHDTSKGAMIRISLAPCSPFSVTPELMKHTANYARDNNLQIHTHLAETLDEESFCIGKYGKRPVKYIEDLGWISNSSWFAHAIHLNQEEIDLLGTANSGVAHCPSSNMRLGSGIAQIREMLDAGIRVSIAVDGSSSNDSSNMLSEIRNAMLLSRLRDESKWLTARDVLRMATRGGAEVLGRNAIGHLKPGMIADLALFSIDSLEYAGSISDPLAALVFNHRSSPVDYLIINGDIQIESGKSRADENELIIMQNNLSRKMLQDAQKKTGINFTKIIH
jgi:cytosine/adenosine deaminase-related metal-dependent hydrolase